MTTAYDDRREFRSGMGNLRNTRQHLPVPPELHHRLHRLVEKGIVERFGRGRGVKYISPAGSRRSGGVYRQRGLERATNQELLVRYIELQGTEGSTLGEIARGLPQLTTDQVRTLPEGVETGAACASGRYHAVGAVVPGNSTKPDRRQSPTDREKVKSLIRDQLVGRTAKNQFNVMSAVFPPE